MLASAGPDQGMPDRVRIYSGGDRPFFEDVSAGGPMVYLIHNLMSGDGEVEHVIEKAEKVREGWAFANNAIFF